MSALEFSRYAVIVLAIGACILPVRYAFFPLLILPLFDASGPRFASASVIGTINVIRTLAVPSVMIVRLKGQPLKILFLLRNGRAPLVVFTILIIYTGLALLWSSWTLSGIKMVGFLFGHILWFALLLYGWYSGCLNRRLLIAVFFTAIAAGIVQSYILEPTFGVYRFGLHRFTAFLSPQYYAAFLIAVSCVLVFSSRNIKLENFTFLGLTFVLLFLTGSRYAFASFTLVITIFFFVLRKSPRGQVITFLVGWSVLFIIAVAGYLYSLGVRIPAPSLEESRIGELRYLLSEPAKIGTLLWRKYVYQAVFNQLGASSFIHIMFGHGTSSGADVVLSAFPYYEEKAIDANRVIHNEFLRALYEWGLIGLSLMILFVVFIGMMAVKQVRRGSYILISVFPLLLSGLAFENVLASAGSAWSTGIALVLGYVWAEDNFNCRTIALEEEEVSYKHDHETAIR